MRSAIRKLVLHYMEEVYNSDGYTHEDLEAMADSFVEAVERLLSARKDFKEE